MLLSSSIKSCKSSSLVWLCFFQNVPCPTRSCLPQRTGLFRLRVLLSSELLFTSPPGACCSRGSVQRGVCGGLRVSSWSLPLPGSLLEQRRLSLFPPQAHLPAWGQDTDEMQHLVRNDSTCPATASQEAFWMFFILILHNVSLFPQCVQGRSVGVYRREVCWPVHPDGGIAGDHIRQKTVCTAWWRLCFHRCGGKTQTTVHTVTHAKAFGWMLTAVCSHFCVQDFVDRKLAVAVRCGECAAGDGAGGGETGCLKEITVTALHTTVTVTHTGELAKKLSGVGINMTWCWKCQLSNSKE